MATVSVRYIVDDVDAAIAFYNRDLGFHVELHPGPGFAMLSRGDLRLLLSTPTGPVGVPYQWARPKSTEESQSACAAPKAG